MDELVPSASLPSARGCPAVIWGHPRHYRHTAVRTGRLDHRNLSGICRTIRLPARRPARSVPSRRLCANACRHRAGLISTYSRLCRLPWPVPALCETMPAARSLYRHAPGPPCPTAKHPCFISSSPLPVTVFSGPCDPGNRSAGENRAGEARTPRIAWTCKTGCF